MSRLMARRAADDIIESAYSGQGGGGRINITTQALGLPRVECEVTWQRRWKRTGDPGGLQS